MNSKQYQLAIVIPCWNVEKYIPSMLESLVAQSFKDWKALCVDDGSTDLTAKIITTYQQKDDRFQYIRRDREPKGSQTCRNIGIDAAIGAKYLIFLDADDIIAPYCFEQRVNYLDKHPNDDYAVFRAKSFRNSLFETDSDMYGFPFVDNALMAMLNWNLTMLAVTNIYRYQSLVDNNVHWDERLSSLQDSDFNIQVLAKKLKYSFAERTRVDYFYLITNNGIANKIKTKAHYESHLYLLNKTLTTVSQSTQANDVVLQNNILLFYNLIKQDKESVKKILRLQWLRDRKINYLKMWLYILWGGRGKKYLFPKERNFSREMNQKWRQATEKNIVEFLEMAKNDDDIIKLDASLKP